MAVIARVAGALVCVSLVRAKGKLLRQFFVSRLVENSHFEVLIVATGNTADAVLFGLIHAEQAFAAVKFEHLAVNLDFAFAHPDQARLHIDREKQSRRSVPVITYTATAPLSTFRSEPIFLLGQ